jgi:hypothetical protein
MLRRPTLGPNGPAPPRKRRNKGTYAAAIMERQLPSENPPASGKIDERRLAGDDLDPAYAGAVATLTDAPDQ